MIINTGRILASAMILCAASIGLAQDQNAAQSGAQPRPIRPIVAFPPTPTPRPPVTPLTQAQLDTMVIPSAFLGRTSNVLTIVYNGFRRSQVDPCGCVSHQLGGLDKEARIIQRIEAHKLPMIQVDAGGFMHDLPDQKFITQSEYLLKGLGEIGYDAVNVGFTDLAVAPTELKEKAKQAGLALLSANIQDDTGKLVFDPYTIKEVALSSGKTIKIGIIGVTRPRNDSNRTTDQISPANPNAKGDLGKLSISNPAAAINKFAPEVAAKSDFVIVLDYDRRGYADKIVNAITDKSLVDVMVLGENSQLQANVQELDGIQIVSGGYEGRQVGALFLGLSADNNVATAHNMHIEVLQSIPSVPAITKLIKETHAATKPAGATTTEPEPMKLDLGQH